MFRRIVAVAAGAALAVTGMVAAPAAMGTETASGITKGNADTECQSAGFDYGIKLDTGEPATYTYPPDGGKWEGLGHTGSLTVTISDEHTFSFTASPPVAAVLVKAANHYDILPGGSEGTDLTPSISNGISHISFCYNEGPTPEEHLTVSKTAVTSFHRTHNWTLDKVADPSEVWLYAPGGAGSGTADVDWDVTVGYAGFTDSDYTVSGTVTVTNDGPLAAAVTGVADAMTLNADPIAVAVLCPVDFAVDVAFLQHGESIACNYSVTGLTAAQAVDGTNVVTVTSLAGRSYSNDPVDVLWSDDPTTETNKTVTLTDVSDIPGAGTTGMEFTAPMGGLLHYSNTFDWAGYGTCGDFAYDNTATLWGDESSVIDAKTESVSAHVQCRTFQGETAWAANMGPNTLPYNTKKGGNWATYVQYPNTAPVVKVYNVYAGQTKPAGTATVTPVGGGMVTVTLDLSGSWQFAGATSNMKIEKYALAPSGNPSPGLFTYKTNCASDPCTSGPIPVAKFYGIHADVGVWVPDPLFGP